MAEWHQVWKCTVCGTKRHYGGDVVPETDKRKALIWCEGRCSRREMRNTWHVFVEVAKDDEGSGNELYAYA